MKPSKVARAFQGTWRITSMELWSADAIDMDGEGCFIFDGDGGRFQFICVHGLMHRVLHCRGTAARGVYVGRE